jgi:hypothetical protein
VWSRAGHSVKLTGHVSFPEVLDLTRYMHAATQPLLPQIAAPETGLLALLAAPPVQKQAAVSSCSTPAANGPPADASVACHAKASSAIETRAASAREEAGRLAGMPDAKGGSNWPKRTSVCQGAERERASGARYRLIAVVEHSGGARFGHYTAFRKVPAYTDDGGPGRCSGGSAVSERGLRCRQPCSIRPARIDGHTGVDPGECTCHASCQASLWVHTSDEAVVEAELEAVLSCEASVLFYELF